MRNILILTILFFSLGVNAQLAKGSLYEKGILYFKDGSSEEGLVKRRPFGGVKFKKNKDSKPESYDSNTIIGYDDLTRKEKYLYKTVGDFTTLMKVVQLGKINLYSVFRASGSIPISMAGSNTGVPMMSMSYGGSSIYYIEKNKKTINIGQKIRKNEWYLFKDCPVLLDKMKQKEFKKNDIKEIIDFYNKCT